MEVLEKKKLEFENLISYRDLIFEHDVNNKIMEMAKVLKDNGVLPNGPLISTTYGIDPNGKLDMEILLPIDSVIVLENEFKFKKRFCLNNAIFIRHFGNPTNIVTAYEKLAEYIAENNMQQITTGYNVNISNNIDTKSLDNYVIDIYIGVSDNIL